eukprot:PITA_19024
MNTSICDQFFMNQTMAECSWNHSNIDDHYDISKYMVLGETNELLASMGSNFLTGNSSIDGTEVTRSPNTEFVHEVIRSQNGNSGGDQPYSCAWNTVYPHDFNENSIWCGDSHSSKCFKPENWEDKDKGNFCLNYGVEFDQNVFGADTAFKRDDSKDQSVYKGNNICENLREQALQNELELICSNVSGVSNVGSDFSNFAVRCLHENSTNMTIGRPCHGISFSQYDEMEMNGRFSGYDPEIVISKLLDADMTSIEPLDFEGTKGIATVSVNEQEGFDDRMPLSTSNKTEIYTDDESPHRVISLPVKDSEKRVPISTVRSQVASNDGNREENYSSMERVLAKNDDGMMANLASAERDLSNVKAFASGVSKDKSQPAKNLLAERRRRKRLNERLSILRSVVPTITKMDRTSIVMDTIKYTKQLVHQIRCLQSELQRQTDWPAHLRGYEGYFHPAVTALDQKFIDKNVPKLEVQRSGSQNLNIHMTCQANPTILLSTICTVESFGLDIQQAVISCFSEFGMQAHCSEIDKAKSNNRPEDIRLALLQTGGFLGKN